MMKNQTENMRKILYVLILALCNLSAFGQITESDLLPVFGKIRADMVREACAIAGFNDPAAVNAIETRSLTNFLNKVITMDTLLYNIIKKSNRPLSGAEIDVYMQKMKAFSDTLSSELTAKYPGKKEAIEEMKSQYAKAIEEALAQVRQLAQQQHAAVRQTIDVRHRQALDSIKKLSVSNEAKEKQIRELENRHEQERKELDEKHRDLQEQFETKETAHTALTVLLTVVIAVLAVILYIVTGKRKPVQKSHSSVVVSTLNENSVHTKQAELPQPDPKLATVNPELPTLEAVNPKPPKPPVKTSATNGATAFAVDADEWIVVGASVTGNGHIASNMPCQDNHIYEYWGDGWGIAIVSDGAGSAQNSHIGSKLVTHRGTVHFKTLVEREKWMQNNELPKDMDWFRHSYSTLKLIRNDMERFAREKGYLLKSLNATVIVVIHSPRGILAAHAGDGRAGYKNEKGEWKALITPHKGEEANQTVFLPSEFWNIPNYAMSGVLVPESVVVREKPFAFTLMSDGCENTAWQYYQMNPVTGHYYDPNKPHPPFFDPLEKTLQSFRNENVDPEERKNRWKNFIESGNRSFVREQDDKTMIFGVLYL